MAPAGFRGLVVCTGPELSIPIRGVAATQVIYVGQDDQFSLGNNPTKRSSIRIYYRMHGTTLVVRRGYARSIGESTLVSVATFICKAYQAATFTCSLLAL